MASKSDSVIKAVHYAFILIFFIVTIWRWIPLFWMQFKMWIECKEKINEKNKVDYLHKGKNWHKMRNKKISIILTKFRSAVEKNEVDDSYTLKIKKSSSILAVIHELAHIKNKDCEGHLNNSLIFAISLAWKYITIFEPRAIQSEVDYFVQNRRI